MMSNNKILTVSYGTFSCTLEGFDDSFDTMKAIAEYFRDLAADDRYFGAEPPQPDADMLARIAEREVARRVEAREHDGKILLKAHQAAEPAAPVAEAPAPAPASVSAPSEPPAPAPAAVPTAAVAAAAPAAATNIPDEAAAFFADSTPAETVPEDVEAEEVEATADIPTDVLTAATAPATEAEQSDDTAFDEVEDVAEPVAPPQPSESFAEKLQRIRAVVSTQEAALIDTAYDEDAEAPLDALSFDDGTGDEAEEMINEATDDIEAALAQDDETAEDVLVLETEAEEEGDELDAILSRIEQNAGFAADDTDDAEETAEEEATENLFAEHPAEDEEPEVAAEAPEETEAAEHAKDEAETAEDEAMQDLAAKDAETTAENATEAEAEAPADAEQTPAARHHLPTLGNDAEEDVSRLMAEADHQMQEPEGKTRRSAFAHLRAAVAARFADRSMEDAEKAEAAQADAYRSDLAEAVKPRHVSPDEAPKAAASALRAAPLTLVAEQRVNDLAESPARGPVAPRRVATSDEEIAAQGGADSFAAYAEERGAATLPELLEAAAAYLSYVEGHEQFSRPQLMSRVRQADCGEFSREDGLRSFGQLLRTGKIEKIKGGRFTASEGIGYKPGHRAAG